jgi:hypothetical protein
VSLVGLPRFYLDISILSWFCHIGGTTRLLVFVKCRHFISIKELIRKPYIKFEFKPNNQTRSRKRGESLPGKPGGTGFANPVAPVLGSVVILLRMRQSRYSGDFSKDSGLSKNSREKSGVSGFH